MVLYKDFEKPMQLPNNKGKRGTRGTGKQAKTTYDSLKRTRENIKDLVLNNEFTHWGTLTFDQKKINRYDLDEIQKKTSQYLYNIKQRKDNNLQYLLVFEQHKDGAWHCHMFLNTLQCYMEQSINKKGNDITENGQNVLNWSLWASRFGFTKFINISHLYKNTTESYTELMKVANYITKYITKDLILLRANKKKYWCSRSLQKPIKTTYTKRKSTAQTVPFHKSNYSIVHKITGEVVNTITTTCYEDLVF